MHPCLSVPDIIHLICNEIRQQDRRSDLASLARTCRAWSEIALENLWYKIDSMEPFIKCMPQGLWQDGQDQWHLVGHPAIEIG